MLQRIRNFFRRDSQKGQGIVEYALILAFVAAIAAFAFSDNLNLKGTIQGLFTNASNNIKDAAGTASTGGGGQQGGN